MAAELYTFRSGDQTWRFTNNKFFDVDLGGDNYYHRVRISRSKWQQEVDNEGGAIQIDMNAEDSSASPAKMVPAFIGVAPGTLQVTVSTKTGVDIFRAYVVGITYDYLSRNAELRLQNVAPQLQGSFPARSFGPYCAWDLGAENDHRCGVDLIGGYSPITSENYRPGGLYATPGIPFSIEIDADDITISADGKTFTHVQFNRDNCADPFDSYTGEPWFVGGYIVNQRTGQRIFIVSHDQVAAPDPGVVTTLMPFGDLVTSPTPDTLRFVTGCSHMYDTCNEKFANAERQGGFPAVPRLRPQDGFI